jgi:hypothetical protein
VVTITASATPTSMFINTAQVSGGLGVSPEDSAVRACNGSSSSTTSPTVTSGSPSLAGDLFVSAYGAPSNSSGFTYTNDSGNGWTQLGGTGGNTNGVAAIVYQTNAGAGTKTNNPTTSSAGYALATMAFFDATPPAAGVSGGLGLLGVGN